MQPQNILQLSDCIPAFEKAVATAAGSQYRAMHSVIMGGCNHRMSHQMPGGRNGIEWKSFSYQQLLIPLFITSHLLDWLVIMDGYLTQIGEWMHTLPLEFWSLGDDDDNDNDILFRIAYKNVRDVFLFISFVFLRFQTPFNSYVNYSLMRSHTFMQQQSSDAVRCII